MTTNLSQLENAAFLYVNGLQLSWTSNTTLTIAPGICRDSTNAEDLNLGGYGSSAPVNTVVNSAINGVNGLDTGAVANATWYAVYVIGDASGYKPTGTLLSASATAPTLPAGYNVFRQIGWALTDGSAHFLKFYTVGNAGVRQHHWDSMISVLAAGVATAFTGVSCSAAVPPVNSTVVTFYAGLTPAVAGDAASFRPTGSSATTVFDMTGLVTTHSQDLQFKMLTLLSSGNPSLDYKVSSGSDSLNLSVLSFDYSL
jgi:hypothetical protein